MQTNFVPKVRHQNLAVIIWQLYYGIDPRTQCRKQILAVELRNAEIKHSDWMFQATMTIFNQSDDIVDV